MYLRSGTQTTENIATSFESTTVHTTSQEEILQEMVNNINCTNSQQEKIPMLIDLYRYLHQRSQYFKKPDYKSLVSAILEKSSEFKREIMDIIENQPDTEDELNDEEEPLGSESSGVFGVTPTERRCGAKLSNNAYRLYYYIDVVMLEFKKQKSKPT